MAGVSLSHPDTRLGALQRGLGRAYRQVLQGGPGAREDLLACILSDPRWDRQIDQRAPFYAQLMLEVDCSWEPLEGRLHDFLTDPELANYSERQLVLDVLAQAAWRGADVAADILHRYLRQPTLLQHIRSAVFLAGGADLVARVLSPAQLGWFDFREPEHQPEAPVDPRDSTAKLLKRLEGPAPRAEAVIEERASVEELLRYRKRAGVHGYLKVMKLLGKRGVRELIPEALRALRRRDTQAARRRAYLVYLENLPGSVTIDLALGWLKEPKLTQAAQMILRRWAGKEHREALEGAAREALSSGDEHGLSLLAEGLGRLNDIKSLEFLGYACEHTASSHGRTQILKSLSSQRKRSPARPLLHEALWDCEAATRVLACETALQHERLREIAADRFEEEEVRHAAERSLLAGPPLSLN